jgi:hypothetical protein
MQEALKIKTATNQTSSMVWKIRRNGNKDNNNVSAVRGPASLKSCLKKDSDDRSKTSTVLSKTYYSNGADQSTARSNGSGSRSEGSRSHGSASLGTACKSINSRLTDPSSQYTGRQAPGSSEQPSVVSSTPSADGSQGSKASSKNSVKAYSRASQRSSASSYPEKVVRFHDIHIRDYERVVGDNPSCSAGPPVG